MMDIVSWTTEARISLAIRLLNVAKFDLVTVPALPGRQHEAWECIDSALFLLNKEVSPEFLEANKDNILEHVSEKSKP